MQERKFPHCFGCAYFFIDRKGNTVCNAFRTPSKNMFLLNNCNDYEDVDWNYRNKLVS